jgi:segregation and condensation protein B
METKPEHAEIIALLKQGRTTKPLSAQALETLAIVALKQPVNTEEVNAILGLDSYATIKTLVKRKLIGAGLVRGGLRQVNYWETTHRFLDEFGLESLDEIYAAGKTGARLWLCIWIG